MHQILLILMAFSSCAHSQMAGFIVGGQEVSINRWPFITFIEAFTISKNQSSACGGSLLSSQTVLTAAHCLDDMTENRKLRVRFTIFMGHSSFKNSRMIRTAKDYETHRNYDPANDDVRDDIGIMFLIRPVKFIHNVKKTILVNRRFNNQKDKHLLIAGWGMFDTGKNGISANLKDLKLRSISLKECIKEVPYIVDINKVVCAAPAREFAYGGDSGGPLVQRGSRHQLGLVSFRNEDTGITVFTSVPAYYQWINRTNLNLYRKHCRNYKRHNY